MIWKRVEWIQARPTSKNERWAGAQVMLVNSAVVRSWKMPAKTFISVFLSYKYFTKTDKNIPI